MFNYKKIAVVGCCGSGKSTFSKQLAEITGLPIYHLDNIYWQPDKSHLNKRDFIKQQKKILKRNNWIIDGNYGKTMKYRVKRSDLVYFFDLPADICIKGVLSREKNRDDIACELEPDQELIDFIKNYSAKTRPNVINLFNKYKNVKVIMFMSHSEVDDYLNNLRSEYENH